MRNKILVLITLILLFSSNNLVNAQIQSEGKILALDPQLENVNKQIEDLRNQQIRNQSYEQSDVLAEDKTSDSKTLGYILAVFLIIILAGGGLYNFTRPQNIEERRKRREEERIVRQENERINREKVESEKQEILEQAQKMKGAEFQKESDFMDKLRQTPRYLKWRKEVKEKFGNKCQLYVSHENRQIEVHHLDSLYKILKQNDIFYSMEEALKCKPLWSINNGIILCKECHDQMASSKNRLIFNDKYLTS